MGLGGAPGTGWGAAGGVSLWAEGDLGVLTVGREVRPLTARTLTMSG
jgi:hypothetical protein